MSRARSVAVAMEKPFMTMALAIAFHVVLILEPLKPLTVFRIG
jgi:hypothetical protein